MPQKVIISYRTILLVIFTIIAFWLSYELRAIILILFLAYIVNAGLRPIVEFLTKKFRFKRGIAITITYLLIFLGVGLIISVIISAAVDQISEFITTLTTRVSNLNHFIEQVPILGRYINTTDLVKAINDSNLLNFSPEKIYDLILGAVNTIGFQGLNILGGVISFIFNVVLIIIISVYMIQSKKNIYHGVLELIPDKYAKRLDPVLTKIESSLGSWLLGQTILMFAIGIASYIALQIPRFFDGDYQTFKFALVISIMAAIFEAIPNIGPLLTLILATVIAIFSGAGIPIIIYIIISFTVIQQLEGLYLVPRIMNRAIDLNPIITIAGVTAGFELGGPVGALIAVPFLGVAQIVVKELSYEWKKNAEKS